MNETEKQKAKVEQMQRDGKDVYELKQPLNVLEECRMMIPDSRCRLKESLIELKSAIDELKELEGVAGTEVLTTAEAAVTEVDAALVR
jgi:hypothetical protein